MTNAQRRRKAKAAAKAARLGMTAEQRTARERGINQAFDLYLKAHGR